MATTVRQKRRPQRSGAAEAIVEKGDIYFIYRPRIGETEVEGLGAIQRFFMVLKPAGRALFRSAVLGRKRLPNPDRHERIWGFIDRIVKSGGDIENEFREQHYRTKTRGERMLPPARRFPSSHLRARTPGETR